MRTIDVEGKSLVEGVANVVDGSQGEEGMEGSFGEAVRVQSQEAGEGAGKAHFESRVVEVGRCLGETQGVGVENEILSKDHLGAEAVAQIQAEEGLLDTYVGMVARLNAPETVVGLSVRQLQD